MTRDVLLVEDARVFSRVLIERLSGRGFTVHLAETMAQARKLLQWRENRFCAAILDLCLPDAPDGEIVDYINSLQIPAIVFAAQFSDEARESMLDKKVVDYVTKEDPSSIDYIIDIVNRLHLNRNTSILVVDDSPTARHYLASLLAIQQYRVLLAVNGKEALEVITSNPDIKLVLTDYLMPKMDGFELTKAIRRQYSRDRLAVLGISAHGNNLLSARFMKIGASDFISRPFLVEEFNCRIRQNVEMLEHISALRDAAIRDYLTGLFNRRYLITTGKRLFAAAVRRRTIPTIAVLDLDDFKKINDSHGHDAGDKVLRAVAMLLQDYTREADIVARFGGEEFCMLLVDMDGQAAAAYFEKIRREIAANAVSHNGCTIRVTVSIGICSAYRDSLESMISEADKQLYIAKTMGKNTISLAL